MTFLGNCFDAVIAFTNSVCTNSLRILQRLQHSLQLLQLLVWDFIFHATFFLSLMSGSVSLSLWRTGVFLFSYGKLSVFNAQIKEEVSETHS